MILSTTETVPGKVIEIKGTVHAGFFCAFIDVTMSKKIPWKSFSFLPFFKYMDRGAIAEYFYHEVDERLKQKAEALGANAVIAIRYHRSWSGVFVVANGTAVVVEPNE
ncbi:MAG: heavy metal-binding domain-containing protein [Planctomycetaceae bacterium]|nr:heavy metal-binding domain-containing protein [Planctomycetaceae bacterium]